MQKTGKDNIKLTITCTDDHMLMTYLYLFIVIGNYYILEHKRNYIRRDCILYK